MPTYTARDSQTGKTVTFKWNGEAPPTDADMGEVFAAAGKILPPTPPSSLERFGKATRDTFPVAGAMMGGAAGATKGAALGIPLGPHGMVLGGTLGGLAGGIAGGGGGSLIKQGLDYLSGEQVTPEQAVSNVAADTIAAAYGEMIPGAGIAAAKGVLQSPIVQKGAAWVADAFPTGKYLLSRYASKFYREVLASRSQAFGELIGKDIPPGENILEVGPIVKKGIKSEGKKAYAAAKDIGGDAIISVPQYREKLGLAAQDSKIISDDKAYKWVQGQLEMSKNGTMTFPQVDAAQSKINTMLWGRSPDRAESVWGGGLLEDISRWDQRQASPEKLAQAYLKARSLYKDSRGFDSIYSVFRRGTKVLEDGSEALNVGAAKVELNRQEDTIVRQFGKTEGPRIVSKLKEFLNLAGAAMKERNIHPPVSAEQLMAHGVAAGALGSFGVPKEWLVVPYGFSLFAAHSVASPKGYLRAAKAGKLPSMPPLLKLGAKAGTMRAAQELQDDPTQGGAIPLRQE